MRHGAELLPMSQAADLNVARPKVFHQRKGNPWPSTSVCCYVAMFSGVGGRPDSRGAARAALMTQCMVRPCVARGFYRSGGFGLASMYPASDWSVLCSRPGLEWAIWVTRVRTRRDDRSSISFHPLADLGRGTGLCHRPLLIGAVPWFEPQAVHSSRPAGCAGIARRGRQGWPSGCLRSSCGVCRPRLDGPGTVPRLCGAWRPD
jgi:hypothetical protein